MTGTIMIIFFLIFVLFLLQIITMSSYFGGIGTSGTGAATATATATTVGGLSSARATGMVNTQIAFTVIMMLLAIAMYFYITNNPQYERTYIMFMLHSTLFVAVLSTSINVMNKIAQA